MTLQNDYKVLYAKATNEKRAFYASKTGLFKDAELITEAKIGEYKLIYEKNGGIYGSITGVPSEDDYYFEGFVKVFIEDSEVEKAPEENTEEVVKEDTTISEVEEAENGTEQEDPAETVEQDTNE